MARLLLALNPVSAAFKPSSMTGHTPLGTVMGRSRADRRVLRMSDDSPCLDRRALLRLVATLPLAPSLAAYAAELGDLGAGDVDPNAPKFKNKKEVSMTFELSEVGDKPKKQKAELSLDERIEQLEAKPNKSEKEKDKLKGLKLEQECELTGRSCGAMDMSFMRRSR
mmetsp:Transcript_149267/g.274185  ORF Transcript_149267/g.274185 Transcript_149267/m.274185 type:complete len:167 (-) Transcript_149267:78-578(-)